MSVRQKKVFMGLTGVFTLIYLLVVYVTNRYVPFMMDDFWYSTILSDETPIHTLKDILQAQVWHYHNWGGRSMTHTILQMTLLMGEQFADILNVMMTLLLALVICLTAENRSFYAFFAGLAMMLGLNANWKMSMFWQAGAANYLYITSFVLLFLYCYLREVRERPGKELKKLPGIEIWMIPLSILAGWSNENMGPAVWLVSFIIILMTIKEKRKLSAWMIYGNVLCFAGSVIMILAPGNFVRKAENKTEQYGVLWRIFLRCYAEAKASLEYLFPVLLILAFILILGKVVMGIAIGRKNLLLLFAALLSWGAMILSPHYPDRATFGTMILLVCVIISMAGKIAEKHSGAERWLLGGAYFVWLRGMFFCGEFLSLCWGWIQ